MSKIRRLTGEHMMASKQVSPHAFSVVEVDYANVDDVRSARKVEWRQSEGFSLTYLPFISRAVVDVLGDFAHLNASVGDGEADRSPPRRLGHRRRSRLPGSARPSDPRTPPEGPSPNSLAINDLATRARVAELFSPDDVGGATFTISNNGSAGSVLTMPIINQPQVAGPCPPTRSSRSRSSPGSRTARGQ